MASNGNLTDYLTPGIVAECAAAEAAPSAEYVAAADLIPAYSRRHVDADDVSSLARVFLAHTLAGGLTGSMAAGAAVKRATQTIGAMRARQTGSGTEAAAGDTLAAAAADDSLDVMARAHYPAPDGCARITARDLLATLEGMTDADAATLLRTLRTADVWGGQGAADVNVSAVARARYGAAVSGRARQALADVIRDTLHAARQDGRTLTDYLGTVRNGEGASHRERGLVRDSHVPTSGTASAMVRTRPNGTRWTTLADRSVMVTEDAAAYLLAQTDTLPAWHGGTARECTAADLSAPRPLIPARRPAGVGAGMVHGNNLRAGAGAPEPRPTMSRRRKRDGGIGSPMVPA